VPPITACAPQPSPTMRRTQPVCVRAMQTN
jgi:hypothetical protein